MTVVRRAICARLGKGSRKQRHARLTTHNNSQKNGELALCVWAHPCAASGTGCTDGGARRSCVGGSAFSPLPLHHSVSLLSKQKQLSSRGWLGLQH